MGTNPNPANIMITMPVLNKAGAVTTPAMQQSTPAKLKKCRMRSQGRLRNGSACQ